MTVPEIAKKIGLLYSALKAGGNSEEESATKINDIMIFGDKIPPNLLSAAWDFYAKDLGAKPV